MISSNVFDDDNDNDGNDGLLSLLLFGSMFFFIDLIMEYFLFHVQNIHGEREKTFNQHKIWSIYMAIKIIEEKKKS